MSQHNLEQRLNALEACEAIRSLIGRYATAADQRNNPAILQHLFHDDAVWCANGFGAYQGRDNILKGLSSIAEAQVLWSLHIMAMPDIAVLDQHHAEATWMLWEVCHLATTGQTAKTSCLGGFYKTEIRRNDEGEWKFERVELNLTFNQPFPKTDI
ncbi:MULTISPECIES: nuclear transport factor 2 family protein [unclassified Acinetobacter]|uniref:nuclear transport factor 2 family protein n=1 Tax=unclassified Acinetobacter TaxID=196816 RepID=UPI00157A3764|nr:MULTISPECIES: nuclear transport factor 2 family protein [unclassified Acinetobacter]MDM1757366.1 nuclear transport factor 2 family protein [Acinetobacter sp. 256-1]MDM1760358.1 nuclear transport factor 2 family protein [Acinetobacter sp. 251-1]